MSATGPVRAWEDLQAAERAAALARLGPRADPAWSQAGFEDPLYLAGTPPGEAGLAWLQRAPWDEAVLGRPVLRWQRLQAGAAPAAGALVEAVLRAAPRAYIFGRFGGEEGVARAALEAAGFKAVEDLRRYAAPLDALRAEEGRVAGLRLRPFGPGDAAWAEELAVRARNPLDRYHADAGLSPAQADAFMRAWVRDGLAGFADAADLAELDGRRAGFALWRSREGLAKLLLGAVEPSLQGRGVYRALTVQGALARGAAQVEMTTQAGNQGACRAWERAGLRSAGAWTTYTRA